MSARPHDVILRAVNELAVDDQLNGNQRAIVLAVAAYAYEPIGQPSVRWLAKLLSVSPERARLHVRVLESRGWLRFDRNALTVTPGPRIQRQHEAVAR